MAGTVQNKKGGMLTYDLYRLFQQYLRSGCSNMPDTTLLHDLVDGPVTTSEKRKRLRKKFKSWAARMDARPTDGRLVYKSTGKLIVPEEYFIATIKRKHCGPGDDKHLNLTQTIEAVVAEYSVGKREFGIDRDLIVAVVNNCGAVQCQRARQQRHGKGPQVHTNPQGIQFNYVYHVKDQKVPDVEPNSYGQPAVWQAKDNVKSYSGKLQSELPVQSFYQEKTDDRNCCHITNELNSGELKCPCLKGDQSSICTGLTHSAVAHDLLQCSTSNLTKMTTAKATSSSVYLAPATIASGWQQCHVQSACMPTHHSCRRTAHDSILSDTPDQSTRSMLAKHRNIKPSNYTEHLQLSNGGILSPPTHPNNNQLTTTLPSNQEDTLLMDRRYPPIQPKRSASNDCNKLVSQATKDTFQLSYVSRATSNAAAGGVQKDALTNTFQFISSSSCGPKTSSILQYPTTQQSLQSTSCSSGLTISRRNRMINEDRLLETKNNDDSFKNATYKNESRVIQSSFASTKSQSASQFSAVFRPSLSLSRQIKANTRFNSCCGDRSGKMYRSNPRPWLSPSARGLTVDSRDLSMQKSSRSKQLIPLQLQTRAAKINELYTLLLKKLDTLRRSLHPAFVPGSVRMQETLRCYINDSLGMVHKLRMTAPRIVNEQLLGSSDDEEMEAFNQDKKAEIN